MKCRHHNHESGAGVCASCLRERLLALVAAQVDHSPPGSLSPSPSPPPPQQQPQSLPLPFPSSVSPLACRRRSDASASPACGQPNLSSGNHEAGPSSSVCRRSGSAKFSILSTLFGHHQKSEEATMPDQRAQRSSRSIHWLQGLINGRPKKKKMSRLLSADDAVTAAANPRRFCRGRVRGLSPESGESAPESGYNTESAVAGWWRPTPSPRHRETAEHQHHGRGLAGFAVCLSPPVRPSRPSRRRFQGPGLALCGEFPSPCHHRQAAPGELALCPNRSRKLAHLAVERGR
ncbi:hypothetical protein OPV22_002676 [Ensete ventricosum]|uniref:Uncharacterized protein n=1 Tax=Ensete ventricosum TaxID=4639 RepID=A0AAV8RYP6_ENSVE|nr:hypothetical protein OPV22_002676 [Ensete ventricosum]